MGVLHAESPQQLTTLAGLRGEAGRRGRRPAASVARSDRADQPEAVQCRLVEHRLEPCAEDAGVNQTNDRSGAALLIFNAGQGLDDGPPTSARVLVE